MKYKKLTFLILVITFVVMTSYGCIKDQILPSSKIYIKPIINPVSTLDPSQTRFRTDYMVARAIFGQLVFINALGEVKPSVFESWKVSKDGKEYVFKIRNDVYFHSGKKLDIDDVIFSLEYLASNESLVSQIFSDIDGYHEYRLGKERHIKGIERVGDWELKIKLSTSSFIFLVNLADPKIVVLPKNLNNQSKEVFFKNPDGCGPYKLSELSSDGKKLTLTANEKYFLNKPKISSYQLKVMNFEDAVSEFKLGKIHDLEVFSIPTSMHSELQKYGNIFSVAAYSTILLFFNGESPVFKDQNVRRYFHYKVDISKAIQSCSISAIKASGFIPYGSVGWIDPKVAIIEKDIEKKILKDRKTIQLISYGNERDQCIIKQIVSQFNESKEFNVKHLHVSADEAIERLKTNNYDILLDELSIRGAEPFHLLTYFDPRSPHMLTKFRDEKISRMSDGLKKVAARSVRANLYRELDHYVTFDKNYIVPLYSDIRHYFFSKSVNGPTVPALIGLNNTFDEVWF